MIRMAYDQGLAASASALVLSEMSGANSSNSSSHESSSDTLISEETSINMLQLTKAAFQRCSKLISGEKERSTNASEIFTILISYLVHEHLDYAVDIALQRIPSGEEMARCVQQNSSVELSFFDVSTQTHTIIHLLEKQFVDSLLPLIANTTKHNQCLQVKKNEMEKLEAKLNIGLDKTLANLASAVRTILLQEQIKSDFNSGASNGANEEMAFFPTTASKACLKVLKCLDAVISKLNILLEGSNAESILNELGVRVHRVIYEHLQRFTFDSAGGMVAICDVQEYRRFMNDKVGSSKVVLLFDTLHAMCNLLILQPENLRGAVMGEQLSVLDRSVLDHWIQLRTDYKTHKLANFL